MRQHHSEVKYMRFLFLCAGFSPSIQYSPVVLADTLRVYIFKAVKS